MVHPEGQMPKKETDNIDPGLVSANRLPMRLSRPIFQASPLYQRKKHSLPSQDTPFQGFKQLSKISTNNSSTDMKTFNFQFLNISNNIQQEKIGNSQPNMSNLTRPQFNCIKSIQDKMTVSRAGSISRMIPERMTEVEGKSCDAWKNIRKSYVQKEVPVQKVPHLVPGQALEKKRTTILNSAEAMRKSAMISDVHMQTYRDRVIHLLALKDYKKSELLVQLQKDGVKINDINFLGKILLQVANLNATTLSYTLKDSIFKEIQRDWPGFSEEEKRSLDLVLSRKLCPCHNATKATQHKEIPVVCKTDNACSKDHFLHLAGTDTLIKKKGLCPPKSDVQLTSGNNASGNSEKSVILPCSATSTKYNSSPLSTSYLPISNSPLVMKSHQNVCGGPERSGTEHPCDHIYHDGGMFVRDMNKYASLETTSCDLVQKKNSDPIEMQHFMPEKFKCTLAKRKATMPNFTTSMMEKQKIDFKKQDEIMKSNSNEEDKTVFADSGKTCSTSGTPDYLANYPVIVSSDQRLSYVREFRAYYSEYKAMYEKIRISCTPIVDLDSERKNFSPGSKEYEDITKKISVEYQKMRQLNPQFYEEKKRCVFLYNKLVHIKRLINDFDQQEVKSTQ